MDEQFESFAKELCKHMMRSYVIPYLNEHGVIQSYRAKVISKDTTSQTMVIQRPFDSQITLPYTNAASSLTEGSQCTVFVLGSSTNAVVVSDGALKTL